MYLLGHILQLCLMATSVYAPPMAASSQSAFILGRYRPDDPITSPENHAKIARAGRGYRNADAAVLLLSMQITTPYQGSRAPLSYSHPNRTLARR
ncbi:hypothetical protein C8Q79DRAFT_772630 [Trametes meyenii]|nr:hypothetical protein C8Q79DRAFT_772630 [Trametes meyenii]